METISTTQTNRAAAAAQDVTPLAPEAMVEQLRALRQQIPEYVQLTVADAASIRRVAHVDGDFVQATINTAGASPFVQGALARTPDDLRQETEDAARWSAVEDELRAMLKGVVGANLTRRHRIGITALQTYSITRQLVRQTENSDLLPHLAEMRRLNKFRGKRRRAAQPQPPAPQPAPSSAPQPAAHAGSQT